MIPLRQYSNDLLRRERETRATGEARGIDVHHGPSWDSCNREGQEDPHTPLGRPLTRSRATGAAERVKAFLMLSRNAALPQASMTVHRSYQ